MGIEKNTPNRPDNQSFERIPSKNSLIIRKTIVIRSKQIANFDNRYQFQAISGTSDPKPNNTEISESNPAIEANEELPADSFSLKQYNVLLQQVPKKNFLCIKLLQFLNYSTSIGRISFYR